MIPAGSQSPHSIRTVRVLLDAVTETSSAWRHAQRAVEADHLAVEIGIVDAMKHERRKLPRFAQTFGEGHGCSEGILCFLRKRTQHRGTEDPRRNCEDANAKLREFTGRRHGKRRDAA